MAALGHVREAFWEGCHPARRRYVQRFRALVLAIPTPKQQARARHMNVPVSTLSNYWSGRRVPREKGLRAMYQSVGQCVRPGEMPVTLAELEHLRRSAAQQNRDLSVASRIAMPGFSPAVGMLEAAAPGGGAEAAPRPAADRRNAGAGPIRRMIGELVDAQATGDRWRVLGIAWSASKTMTARELSATVAGLRATGCPDLAEAVLLGGGERTHADTMRLALALMAAGLSQDAELVLRNALPPEAC